MLFQLINESVGKTTHCGVLEFTADEGIVYFPYWVYTFSSDKLYFIFLFHCFLHLTFFVFLCLVDDAKHVS